MDATQEHWKPVVGYEGSYEVSDHGRIRSVDRMVRGRYGMRRAKAEDLIPATNRGGYKTICLWIGRKPQKRMVHRLVMAAFVGELPEGTEVCHNDGNPANNRVANLRYDTRSANAQDALRHGRNFYVNKTHCIRGHEFTPENTYRVKPPGRRKCKTCNRDRQRLRRAAK